LGDAWQMVRLSEVAYIEMGQSPASSVVVESSENGVPFLQGNAEFTDRSPRAKLHCTKPPKIAEAADALISVRAPVGAINKADQRYCIGRGLAAVRFTGVDPAFGFHALSFYSRDLRRVAQGTTFEAIGGADLRAMGFPLCSRPEQRGIAAILDTLDEAIRKTEGIIAKLKQIRQGLRHDLLTRGIDERGELRPPFGEAPHLYGDSPLGGVPGEWSVRPLGDIVRDHHGFIQTGPFGSQLHAYEYAEEGIPVVMPQDIEDGLIDESSVARIEARKAKALARHRLLPNDVVFARRGDLSKCAATSAREQDWLCGTGCLLVRIPSNVLLASWLASVYRHDRVQRQVLARAVGSTMVNLSGGLLSGLLIPVPQLEEQRAIGDRIAAMDRRVEDESATARKLLSVKAGLVDDLLTGRVRVPVPEGAPA